VREVDDRAYSPRIVSIGSFHHNEEALRAFEDHKKRFHSRLQNQTRRRGCKVDLEKAMKEMKEQTRECYSEDFGDIESDDFVRMMLLDGCFKAAANRQPPQVGVACAATPSPLLCRFQKH
jgi:hypothetical protein